jgi:hypothetical protein
VATLRLPIKAAMISVLGLMGGCGVAWVASCLVVFLSEIRLFMWVLWLLEAIWLGLCSAGINTYMSVL